MLLAINAGIPSQVLNYAHQSPLDLANDGSFEDMVYLLHDHVILGNKVRMAG
jgi:hypothetical protein